jgi:putative ABC transport system substrate-binding protein
MKPRISLWLIAAIFLATVSLAEAQQPGRVARMGVLSAASSSAGALEPQLRQLNKLGYVEGKNLVVEVRTADNKIDRLPALADELVRLKVDVIYTGGGNAARAAKNATKTIPIVFNGSNDPVAGGLVDSLARPGGNVTGFAVLFGTLGGKRLEILKETLPKLTRVAVLWEPGNRGSEEQWQAHQQPAKELGLQLYSMEVRSVDQLENAFKDAVKVRIGAIAMTQNPIANTRRKQIAELAVKYRRPAIYHEPGFVDDDGLMSYAADREEPYRRVAVMIDKILKGTRPAEIPVEQPTKFELVINLKAAKQIGLTIPPNVLARADRVIR